MIEFFNRLFGRTSSGATAKERLRLVLMSDHLSLAPEMIDAMKRDLVDVISRYVEVDRDKIDVHFEHQDKALAMLANIPITGVNRNGSGANGTNGHSTNGHSAPHAELANDRAEPVDASPGEPEAAPPAAGEAPPPKPKAKAVTASNAARPRRKRRKSTQQ